ncbi:MAG: N-6 DNA methylase [Propionibacteriaceae bacterium]|nr:N-6 DNA methylase [Propionibacteriaceae bacterium]
MPSPQRKPALTIADQLALLATRGLPLPPGDAAQMTRLLADRSFKAHQYGDIILPFTVLRRLDCVPAPTKDHIKTLNLSATLTLAGQEINPQSYAICKADLIVKGQSADAIILGDTLIADGYPDRRFNYCLSNPPFGVVWKKQRDKVTEEHTLRGFAGRFDLCTARPRNVSAACQTGSMTQLREEP